MHLFRLNSLNTVNWPNSIDSHSWPFSICCISGGVGGCFVLWIKRRHSLLAPKMCTLVYLKKWINVACLTHLLYLFCYPATLFLKPSLHSSCFLIISCWVWPVYYSPCQGNGTVQDSFEISTCLFAKGDGSSRSLTLSPRPDVESPVNGLLNHGIMNMGVLECQLVFFGLPKKRSIKKWWRHMWKVHRSTLNYSCHLVHPSDQAMAS